MKNAKPIGTPLSELSTEELVKQQRKLSIILIFFGIMIGIMILACIYITIKKGANAQIGMPLPFLLIYLIFWNNKTKLRNEINSRKSN